MNNLLNIKTPAEGVAQVRKADYNLSNQGVSNLRLAYWNLATEALYEEAVFRGEGATSLGGPFIANTGKHTVPGQFSHDAHRQAVVLISAAVDILHEHIAAL